MSNFKFKTMKSNTIKLLALFFVTSLAFTSCSSDDDGDHDHDHEHEEANTLIYTLTNTTNAADVVTLTFQDLDGEGGADGTYTVVGDLTANASYTGMLQLLHEHEDGDIDDVGAEIAEDDAEDHEIFYINNAGITINTTDVDGNGNPLGFMSTANTGSAGTGSITIAVIHEGKKPNDGTVADALSEDGTTDIEVSFDITVEDL